jgi:hypothetical protein
MGIAKEASQRRHLVALPDTARVIELDNCHRRGGYATISRIGIKGSLEIELWWEFGAKLSNLS